MVSIEQEHEVAEYAAPTNALAADLAAVSNPKNGVCEAMNKCKKKFHF